MENHESKCRLCIATGAVKVKINDKIKCLFNELRTKIIVTDEYSSLICVICYKNLLQWTTFRKRVIQKQQELSEYLTKIKKSNEKTNISLPKMTSDELLDAFDIIENFQFEPKTDPVETITVKTEPEIDNFVAIKIEKNIEEIPNVVIKTEQIDNETENNEETGIQDNLVCIKEEFEPYELQDFNNLNKFEAEKAEIDENSEVKCPHCNLIIKNVYLRHHIRLNHKFFCRYCGKNCSNQLELESHVETHLESKIYKCNLCTKKFSKHIKLRDHQKQDHKIPFPVPLRTSEEYSNTCDYCGKVLKDARWMPHHIAARHKHSERKHLCQECGKTFHFEEQLQQHLKAVHKDKGFICDFPDCGKRFWVPSLLTKHKNFVHLGIKNFVCEVESCGKSFMLATQLRIHRLKHENLKKENCPVKGCEYQAGRKIYLKNHLKKMHFQLDSEQLKKYIESVRKMKLVT